MAIIEGRGRRREHDHTEAGYVRSNEQLAQQSQHGFLKMDWHPTSCIEAAAAEKEKGRACPTDGKEDQLGHYHQPWPRLKGQRASASWASQGNGHPLLLLVKRPSASVPTRMTGPSHPIYAWAVASGEVRTAVAACFLAHCHAFRQVWKILVPCVLLRSPLVRLSVFPSVPPSVRPLDSSCSLALPPSFHHQAGETEETPSTGKQGSGN